MFAFSFSGRLDRLDWVFYWANEISTLVIAPMFVHFALVFPERAPGWVRDRLGRLLLPLVYSPAVVLGLVQAVTLAGDASSAVFTTQVENIWLLGDAYLATCVTTGLNGGDQATIRYRDGVLIIQAPEYIQRQIFGYPKVPAPEK